MVTKRLAKSKTRLPAIEKKSNKSGVKTRAAPNRFQTLFAPGSNDYEEKKDPDQLFLDVAEVNISLLSLIRDLPLDRRSRRTVFAEVKKFNKKDDLEKCIYELKGLSSTKLAEKFNLTNDEDLVSIDLKVGFDEAAEAEDRKVGSNSGSSESDEEVSKEIEEAVEEEGTNSEQGISQSSGTGKCRSIFAHPHLSNVVRFDDECVETIESSKVCDMASSGIQIEGFLNAAHQVFDELPNLFLTENGAVEVNEINKDTREVGGDHEGGGYEIELEVPGGSRVPMGEKTVKASACNGLENKHHKGTRGLNADSVQRDGNVVGSEDKVHMRHSWSHIVKGGDHGLNSKPREASKLEFIAPKDPNLLEVIEIEGNLTDDTFWSTCLLGYVLDASLDLGLVRAIARTLWGKVGLVDVIGAERVFFLFLNSTAWRPWRIFCREVLGIFMVNLLSSGNGRSG
ncbi:hypothetical protein U1Q18_025664 [Sarracenia purpurea var. burkii]